MLTEKQKEILDIAESKKIKKDYIKICLETLTCPDCGKDLDFYKYYGSEESKYQCEECSFMECVEKKKGFKS